MNRYKRNSLPLFYSEELNINFLLNVSGDLVNEASFGPHGHYVAERVADQTSHHVVRDV